MDIQATMTEFQTVLGMTTVAITKIVKEKYQNEHDKKSNRVNCREAKITRSSIIDTLTKKTSACQCMHAILVPSMHAVLVTSLLQLQLEGFAPQILVS